MAIQGPTHGRAGAHGMGPRKPSVVGGPSLGSRRTPPGLSPVRHQQSPAVRRAPDYASMLDLPAPTAQYAPSSLPAESIYIVADSANLFSGAQMIDGKRNMDIKVNLATTLPLIDDGRPIKQRVVVASFPERSNRMWRYFEQRRYQIYYKTEEADVDEELFEQIRAILCQATEPRKCLVLVTGDGNAHKGHHNFPQLLTHALQHGWIVEVVCWRDCVNPVYETLRNDYPTQMRLRYLDNHRDEITFLKPRMTGESGGDKQHGGHHHGHHHPHHHHHFSRPFAGGYPVMPMGVGAGRPGMPGMSMEPSTLAASSKVFYPRPSVHASVTGYPQPQHSSNNLREEMAEARSAHPNKFEDGSSAATEAVESLSGGIDLLSLGGKGWGAQTAPRATAYGCRAPPGLGIRAAPSDGRMWNGAMGGTLGMNGTGYHSAWGEASVFSPAVGGQSALKDATRAPPMAFKTQQAQQQQQQQQQRTWGAFDGWGAPSFFGADRGVATGMASAEEDPIHLPPSPEGTGVGTSPTASWTSSPALALSPSSMGSSSPVVPMCNLSLSPQPDGAVPFARSRSIESDIGMSQCLEGRV